MINQRAHLQNIGAIRVALLALLGTLLTLTSFVPRAFAQQAPTIVNEPPPAGHSITAFPARDFVSAEGYRLDETYTVQVQHSDARGGATVSSQSGIVPGEGGLIEVNHPGGACWTGVTPNIVAGDLVRVVVDSSPDPDRIGVTDQTTVADVTAGRPSNPAPGTIVVHGTAKAADGGQIPVDQIEARLVAPNQTFQLGGRRDLRAPGTRGATLEYDAAGSTDWTATFTGLSSADVDRALGAESMGAWLGRDPAAGTEGTIYETGAGVVGGPQAPCTAPKEKLPPLPGEDAEAPSVPTGLTATVSDLNTVTLNWDAATDNTGVTSYGVYRNGVPIFTVQNADASAPAPTTFTDLNVPPGDYEYTVDAGDAVDNRSDRSGPAAAATQAKPAPEVPVAEPPTHPFTIFPSRDMVDVEGLTLDQQANVEVIRDGKIISTSSGLIPDSTGLVEINHVGAGCWNGTTPDIRANDHVRATVYNPDGSVAWIDQATVANVVAQKAVAVQQDDPATAANEGVVTIKGHALAHDGSRIPIDQLEQRLVASTKAPFGINGKRTIRADASGQGQGTLSYDPISADNPDGSAWTATYKNLDAADVKLATSVESRVMWLGRAPLAGLELTIFEVGLADPPGPATPDCVAPLEPIDTASPSAPELSASPRDAERSVDLAWTASTDNAYVYGYRIFQDGKQIATVGGDKTTYTATQVNPGTHAYSVEAFDSASPTGAGTTDVERVQAGLGNRYGNTSARSADASAIVKDVQAPTVPKNLQVTNPTNVDPVTGAVTGTRNARVVFDPSTDDSGADPTYEIYRDGVLLPNATPTLNANGKMVYTDQRLTTGQTYRYAVLAKDAAGNKSAKTEEAPVTITPDATAPTFTGSPTATVPDIHGKDVKISWQAATDNVGVTGYGIYRDGTRIATVGGSTLSYTDSNLDAGTYKYKVDAVDSAGNRSGRADQPATTAAIANDPPSAGHTVIAYPARDFVEGDGYVGEGPVTVEVFRNNNVVGKAAGVQPDAAGLVEINHAGPGCWDVNTPDIRPGDVVRITPSSGKPDQTTAAGVYAERPIQTAPDTVIVHGTAKDAAGNPIPLDQIEGRLISDNQFRASGTKTLRATSDGAGEGTISYDAPGSAEWTATYKGLVAADVNRALNGESVINWLGRAPLVGNELTIFENGPGTDGGPAAGACTAPLDPQAPLVSLSPANRLAFGAQSATPATTSAAKPVTLSNAGSSPLDLTKVYLGGANPGDFAFNPATLPATLAPGASTTVNVTFSPKAVGTRSATLNFVDNAANSSYQTIDLTGNGTDEAAPAAPGRPTQAITGTQLGATTVPVKLNWAPSATGTVTHYQLQQSSGGGAFTDVTPQPGTATSTTLNLAAGNYRYQVRACNNANCSAWTLAPAFALSAVQEGNNAISYGGTWTNQAVTGAFGGSVRHASTSRDKATYKFTGTQVEWIGTTGPNRGRADVFLDGVRVATVDLYSPTVATKQVLFSRDNLSAATSHQLEVRVLGARNPSSTGTRIDVDAFVSIR